MSIKHLRYRTKIDGAGCLLNQALATAYRLIFGTNSFSKPSANVLVNNNQSTVANRLWLGYIWYIDHFLPYKYEAFFR